MAEDIEVKAHLTAEDDASPVIRNLLANVRKLERITAKLNARPAIASSINGTAERALADHKRLLASQKSAARSTASTAGKAERVADAGIKKRMAFADRMRAQVAREERQRDLLTMKNLRQRINFSDRMNRQRQREERAAASEARRQQATAHRDERAHRALMARNDRQSRQRRRETNRNAGRVGDAASDAAGAAGRASLIVGAGAVVAARRAITVELSNDDAMRNLQAYGGIDFEAVKKLRNEWAEGAAIDLGSTVADLLGTYTNALKAGIPNAGARDFTALASKAAEAWSLPVENVVDTLSTVSTILTSDGSKYDPKRLSSVVNTTQALAAQMATTPEKLIEFQRQAAGSAQLLGMSQEAMLSIGAASTSLGNKAGESGSMMDFVASKLINLPAVAKRQGIEGDQARALVRSLGYGSADALDRDRRKSPDDFVFSMFEKLSKLKGKQRDTALRSLFGTEWLGEGSRLATGYAKVREARNIAKDPASQRAVDDVWSIHGKKLSFALKQMRASLSNVLGGFGEVLSPFARGLANKLRDWLGASGQALKVNFWAGLRGLTEGLLGREGSFRDFLDSVFGKGGLVADPKRFYDFAKGFAEGLKTIWNTVQSIMTGVGKALGIDTENPEGLGKVLGLAIGGGIAAKLAPTDLLGSLAKGASGLVGGLAGGVAGAAAIGAAPVSLAAITAGLVMAVSVSDWSGLLGGIRDLVGGLTGNDLGAAAKGASNVYGSLWKPNPFAFSRSWGESVTRFLFGEDALPKPEATPSTSPSPTARPALGNLNKASIGGNGPSFARTGLATLDVFRRRILGIAPAEPVTPAPATPNVRQGADMVRGIDRVNASVRRLEGRLGYDPLLQRAGLYSTLRGGGSAANAVTEQNSRFSDMASNGRADELRAMPSGNAGRRWIENYDGMTGRSQAYGTVSSVARSGQGWGEFRMADGSVERREGTRAWRNNNPGNIEAGAFARANGAVGTDGRFAVFPSLEAGRRAKEALLFNSAGYAGMNLSQAITRYAPPNENDTARYIAQVSQAAGVNANTPMGSLNASQRQAMLAAMERVEGFRTGRTTTVRPGTGGTQNAGAPGSAAGAVDSMTSMLGASETGPGRNTVNAFMRANGVNIDAAQTAWCAGFVNANLNAMGIRGTGRLNANSFLNWGSRIDPRNVARGDVLVEHRGRGANETGGHVGMATGNTRVGPNGQQQIEMIAGNSGGRRAGGGAVQTTWEDSSSLAVRRAASAVPTPAVVAANVPLSPAVATSAGTGGRTGSGPVNVTNNITVNGANQSPEQIASAVQRQVSDRLMFATQDVDLGD